MADDVLVDNGSGTDYTVASDDASGAQVQLVKLAYAADGSRSHVPASANGLGVDVVQLDASSGGNPLMNAHDTSFGSAPNNELGVTVFGVRNQGGPGSDGNVGPLNLDADGNLRTVTHRPGARITATSAGLTTATTAYTSGDQVGTILSLSNAARASGGTGAVTGLLLTSAADITGGYDVMLFRQSVTLASDNAAFAISDADSLHLLQQVQLYSATDIGNNRIAIAQNIYVPYDCSGSTTLYAALITRAGHTFFGATTDLQLTAFVERN